MKKEDRWSIHDGAWRDPAQVASQWPGADDVDPELLRYSTRGSFWEVLETAKATLLVTREYEHLAVALCVDEGRPRVSYFPLPHPSGLACDRKRAVLHLAATRNPNQIFTFRPATDREPVRPLVPVTCRYYPGRTYLHDLALVGGVLHANAVGTNAVARLERDGSLRRVWWPRCIESSRGRGARFDRNFIQLNSIAAGPTLRRSFFSASADEIGARRPGHRNFPVDGRGVVFSGATREPVVRGLTRPHSARLHRGRLFVANSGYGEVGTVSGGRFEPIVRLRGWTRGLAFVRGAAIAGTSRVIPRFRSYAPGLDADESRCGLHVLDLRTGGVVGSLFWPEGNQVFAVDWLPSRVTMGFPFVTRGRRGPSATRLFYSFETATDGANR